MNPLEVVWISDDEIEPPGPKMVVCVEPFLGFYFRINSQPHWEPCIPIERLPHHEFLKWDSFIECRIIDPDDYIISESVRKGGIIGRVSPSLCEAMLAALGGAGHSRADRNAIHGVLSPLIPR